MRKKRVPALLLAAGMGSRLSPLTATMPKCLVPIFTGSSSSPRPLLDFWLEKCIMADMSPIIVNTSYLAKTVRDYIHASQWKERIVIHHEENLLGTGGTLLALKDYLQDGTFFVAHADNLSFFDMNALYAAHKNRPANAILTGMLFHTPTPTSCGIVELDKEGIVTAFHEKVENPPSNLANGAVYFMEPDIFPLLKKSTASHPHKRANTRTDISLDLIPQCIGRMNTYINDDYHRDIGTPESYAQAQSDMQIRFANAPKYTLEKE